MSKFDKQIEIKRSNIYSQNGMKFIVPTENVIIEKMTMRMVNGQYIWYLFFIFLITRGHKFRLDCTENRKSFGL